MKLSCWEFPLDLYTRKITQVHNKKSDILSFAKKPEWQHAQVMSRENHDRMSPSTGVTLSKSPQPFESFSAQLCPAQWSCSQGPMEDKCEGILEQTTGCKFQFIFPLCTGSSDEQVAQLTASTTLPDTPSASEEGLVTGCVAEQ